MNLMSAVSYMIVQTFVCIGGKYYYVEKYVLYVVWFSSEVWATPKYAMDESNKKGVIKLYVHIY